MLKGVGLGFINFKSVTEKRHGLPRLNCLDYLPLEQPIIMALSSTVDHNQLVRNRDILLT